MSTGLSLVSVIIPTHNRVVSLQRTLDALVQQIFPADDLEVIIVADCCNDDTLEMLRLYSTPFRLEIVEQRVNSAAAARNAGAEHARGQLLLFLDDDVVPRKDLIQNHLLAHNQQFGTVVVGPYPTAINGRPRFLHILTRLWWARRFNEALLKTHRMSYRDLLSGNLSLEKSLFEQLGGFDSTIEGAGNEDSELGTRVIQSGIPIRYVNNARALHYDHETLDVHGSMMRARQEGQVDVQIGERHDELRSTLPLTDLDASTLAVLRFFRKLALDRPNLGDPLASFLESFLEPLEKLRFRGTWFNLFGLVRDYWYWRGVRDRLPGRIQVANYLLEAPTNIDSAEFDLDLDLKEGIAEAMQLIDQVRPLSIHLRYGRQVIGRIPVIPGSEPLHGNHVRFLLATEFAFSLAKAIALETALLGDHHDTHGLQAFMLNQVRDSHVQETA